MPVAAAPPRLAELRVDVIAPWPFRMPRRLGADGLARRKGDAIQRLVHFGDQPVLIAAIQVAPQTVRVAARAATPEAAGYGIARMRHLLAVDDDLREFHERFKDDPLIGKAVRSAPWLRPHRRPDPFESLTWAVTEQLIEYEEAARIQRRLIRSLGRFDPVTGMWDAPTAQAIADAAPAELAATGLVGHRAISLRRAAREVATGRVDLHDPDHEPGWRRLLVIPGIGPWTIEVMATAGQGRYDMLPAGDLGYVKLVGRLLTGHPKARVEVETVREFMAPYGEWAGLAGEYLLYAAGRGLLPDRVNSPLAPAARRPGPAGTHWSPHHRPVPAA